MTTRTITGAPLERARRRGDEWCQAHMVNDWLAEFPVAVFYACADDWQRLTDSEPIDGIMDDYAAEARARGAFAVTVVIVGDPDGDPARWQAYTRTVDLAAGETYAHHQNWHVVLDDVDRRCFVSALLG